MREGSCGNSQEFEKLPACIFLWVVGWVGSQHLSCTLSRFVYSRVFALAQVLSGVHQILGVCAATPTKYKGRVRRRPPLWMSCHGPPSEVCCLLVLQGYVNPWPSWVAVSRRFYNAECVILILLVEENLMRAQFSSWKLRKLGLVWRITRRS